MPEKYRRQLADICAADKRVILKFVPPMHISDAIRMVAEEQDWSLPNSVQFRLDDDDCVSKEYIRRLRRHASGMWRNGNFGISFSQQYYCITDGPTEGIYDWYSLSSAQVQQFAAPAEPSLILATTRSRSG